MTFDITETQVQIIILALQEIKINEYNFRLSSEELLDIQMIKDKLTKELNEKDIE